jgi:hypothetical protein
MRCHVGMPWLGGHCLRQPPATTTKRSAKQRLLPVEVKLPSTGVPQ